MVVIYKSLFVITKSLFVAGVNLTVGGADLNYWHYITESILLGHHSFGLAIPVHHSLLKCFLLLALTTEYLKLLLQQSSMLQQSV